MFILLELIRSTQKQTSTLDRVHHIQIFSIKNISLYMSLHFSSLVVLVIGGTCDSAEIFFQSFLQEAVVSSSNMGWDVHSLMLSIQCFLCRPLSTALQVALWDGFEEAVMVCDMPELCEFPSLDSCQKRFLWGPQRT